MYEQSIDCIFKLGWSTVSGLGRQVDRVHDNVLRLEIRHTCLVSRLRRLFSKLPESIRTSVSTIWPALALPSTVILKSLKQEDGVDWTDEFEREKFVYTKLKDIQGTIIPICYGEAEYLGTRALVLSDVGGIALNDDDLIGPDPEDVRSMLKVVFRALHARGFTPGDLKLDNFHLVGDRIVPLDFEMTWDLTEREDEAQIADNVINHLVRQYTNHQRDMKVD